MDDNKISRQFWDKLYDDIEGSIVTFFSIDDIMRFLVLSKKLNKMMTRLVYNDSDFHQGFENGTILPAMKQAIMVQYFPFDRNRIFTEEEETDSGWSIGRVMSGAYNYNEIESDNNDEDDATKLEKKKAEEEHVMKIHKEKEIIENIKLILSKNITISKWFLNYLLNDNEYLLFNLFKSNEKNEDGMIKRVIFTLLIIIALKALKPFELNGIKQVNVKAKQKKQKEKENEKKKEQKEKEDDYAWDADEKELLSLKFIHLLLSFIDEIVPKYWRKMNHFWRIFEELIMFDHEYRYYLVNIEFISTLGDFYLREKSPYANEIPNKKYVEMGHRYHRPSREQVIHLISVLLRCCHSRMTQERYNEAIKQLQNNKFNNDESIRNTSKPNMNGTNESAEDERMSVIMDLFTLPKGSLSYYEEKYSFDDYKCMTLFELSERDKKLAMEPLFWHEMVSDIHYTIYTEHTKFNYIQDVLHHWCCHDISFSAGIIKMIIEKIDHGSVAFYHMPGYLLMIQTLLSIDEDKLLSQRFKIMFNCHDDHDDNNWKMANSNSNDVLEYGKGATNTNGKRIDLIDVIESDMNGEKRFGIKCIETIVNCVIKYKNFGQLMIKIRDRWKMWDLWLKEHCFGHIWADDRKQQLNQLWNGYSSFIRSFGGKVLSRSLHNHVHWHPGH